MIKKNYSPLCDDISKILFVDKRKSVLKGKIVIVPEFISWINITFVRIDFIDDRSNIPNEFGMNGVFV